MAGGKKKIREEIKEEKKEHGRSERKENIERCRREMPKGDG